MDSEITLKMENWRVGDWDETQNSAHVMRRKGCAMQNQGITFSETLSENLISRFCDHFSIIQGHYASKMCSNYPGFLLEPPVPR